jgi:hypothetical protein
MELLKMRRSKNKYNNKEITVNGNRFDSRPEARRYSQLLILEKAGIITDLKRQVVFELIPSQFEEYETGEIFKRGNLKGQPKVARRCLEKSVKYIADFTYYDEYGKFIVEDTKSEATKTKDFVIKRKLMLFFNNIKIKEITKND